MENTRIIRVGIVDDHVLTLKGTEVVVKEAENIALIFSSTNGFDLLDHLELNPLSIDIILLDLNMPEINGVELTKRIKSKHGHIKIIVLSMIDDVKMIHRMQNYGAEGYLLKNNVQNELITAIHQVHQGNTYYNENIRKALFEKGEKRMSFVGKSSLRPRLSKREKEVLRLIIKEYTTPEIARTLFISEGTVITHRKHLLTKMNAKNTAGLVRIALEWGLD